MALLNRLKRSNTPPSASRSSGMEPTPTPSAPGRDLLYQELKSRVHNRLFEVIDFGRIATVSAVRPPARFGGLLLEDGLAVGFTEKSQIGEGWINGGFFVLEPQVLDYIEGDSTVFEKEPLPAFETDSQPRASLSTS